MGSVEELCDHIALINKSKKILDGSVKEIRRAYADKTYDLHFKGNLIAFSNALWAGAEIISKKEEEGMNEVRVRLLGKTSPNNLLQAVINAGEVHSFNEVLPTMNDIFIKKVQEDLGQTSENISGTRSNFTE
jgi:ABC-2 type transport system ATP-binding protein